MYSQDLSNYKTVELEANVLELFLYSQDLSNYKTDGETVDVDSLFLYSQDLSNYKTPRRTIPNQPQFLYSQDLSNYKTQKQHQATCRPFLYSQDLSNYIDQSIGLSLQCFFFPTYAIISMNREGFHDWRREYEEKTNPSIGALCIGTCGVQQEAGRSDDPGANNGSGDNCGANNGSPGGARDVF